MATWTGDKSKPRVSICCITYNHEDYIRDAIEGFLIQGTSFPFEILIHDDASTDGTADIIRQFESMYPDIIQPILQTENQLSQGIRPSMNVFPRCKGNYIAMCEGDDYWINPEKLQRQVEALQANTLIDLCFHSAHKHDVEHGSRTIVGRYCLRDSVISTEDIIVRSKGYIPTASLFFRTEIGREFMAFCKHRSYLTVGDIYLAILGASRGGAFYIDDSMSAYRARVTGSWSKGFHESMDRRLLHFRARVKSFREMDDFTARQYSDAFKRANGGSCARMIIRGRFPISVRLRIYYEYRDDMTIWKRLYLLPFIVIPVWLTTNIMKFRQLFREY